MPDAHRTEADIDIGKRNPQEAGPCPLLVSRIQGTHEVIYLLPNGVIGNAIKRASDQVPERMTPEYITGKKDDVDHENEAPNSDPESVRKEEPPHGVVDQKTPDNV
jgi:hypothetical protein